MKKILLFTAALCCSVALNAGLVRIGYIAPTDQNANDLLAESNFSSTGNASYNKTTRTLTLTNCVVDSTPATHKQNTASPLYRRWKPLCDLQRCTYAT